jgi:hypothetical protein
MIIALLEQYSNAVGMIGVITILIAYYLLSTKRMAADTILYQFLNFIGAWLILFSLVFHWNTASVTIEIAWILISMIGMYKVYKEKKQRKCPMEQFYVIGSERNNS